jgi:DNA-binding transcriptional ArsR family regulator
MRPLAHPSADGITVEGVLHALSDPVRVRIFAEIAGAGGPKTCSAFLESCDGSVPKSTLSQHFKVLRDAGLIRSERKGVELHSVARLDELNARFGALVQAILEAHQAQLAHERGAKRARRPRRG